MKPSLGENLPDASFASSQFTHTWAAITFIPVSALSSATDLRHKSPQPSPASLSPEAVLSSEAGSSILMSTVLEPRQSDGPSIDIDTMIASPPYSPITLTHCSLANEYAPSSSQIATGELSQGEFRQPLELTDDEISFESSELIDDTDIYLNDTEMDALNIESDESYNHTTSLLTATTHNDGEFHVNHSDISVDICPSVPSMDSFHPPLPSFDSDIECSPLHFDYTAIPLAEVIARCPVKLTKAEMIQCIEYFQDCRPMKRLLEEQNELSEHLKCVLDRHWLKAMLHPPPHHDYKRVIQFGYEAEDRAHDAELQEQRYRSFMKMVSSHQCDHPNMATHGHLIDIPLEASTQQSAHSMTMLCNDSVSMYHSSPLHSCSDESLNGFPLESFTIGMLPASSKSQITADLLDWMENDLTATPAFNGTAHDCNTSNISKARSGKIVRSHKNKEKKALASKLHTSSHPRLAKKAPSSSAQQTSSIQLNGAAQSMVSNPLPNNPLSTDAKEPSHLSRKSPKSQKSVKRKYRRRTAPSSSDLLMQSVKPTETSQFNKPAMCIIGDDIQTCDQPKADPAIDATESHVSTVTQESCQTSMVTQSTPVKVKLKRALSKHRKKSPIESSLLAVGPTKRLQFDFNNSITVNVESGIESQEYDLAKKSINSPSRGNSALSCSRALSFDDSILSAKSESINPLDEMFSPPRIRLKGSNLFIVGVKHVQDLVALNSVKASESNEALTSVHDTDSSPSVVSIATEAEIDLSQEQANRDDPNPSPRKRHRTEAHLNVAPPTSPVTVTNLSPAHRSQASPRPIKVGDSDKCLQALSQCGWDQGALRDMLKIPVQSVRSMFRRWMSYWKENSIPLPKNVSQN